MGRVQFRYCRYAENAYGTNNLKDKYQLMDILEIAERKKKWHYRQENFNVSRASTLLQTMLNSAYKKLP
jgi:hypothetical protein